MPKDQEDVRHPEGDRQHGEEVDGGDLADVIPQEASPVPGRWLGLSNHVDPGKERKSCEIKEGVIFGRDRGQAQRKALQTRAKALIHRATGSGRIRTSEG